ncbi:MAG TPA: hypothetical protein VGB23_00445 [Nitrospirota bacterium]|jgi:hypothetical protein
MASSSDDKKPYMKAVVYGVISIASLAAVLTNQEAITALFTRGKWYTLLPIATVFFFSFVHGSFANYALSAMGMEAKKKR